MSEASKASEADRPTAIRTERIYWGDCDPAGIIYFPRYFEIFDRCTTTLLEQRLGMSKYQFMIAYQSAGCPMVDLRARFLHPIRYGDEVVVETAIIALRRSSFDVRHRLHKDGRLAAECFETRVWVRKHGDDPTALKSQPLPDEVVARLGGR